MIYLALLRAINLGPHNKVAMADLRELLLGLDLEQPRSLLQTGNLVFGAERQSPAGLERLLETEAERRLHLRTDFFVRTAKEWRALIAANPYPDEAVRDPSHLIVMFCKESVGPAAVVALQAAIRGRERVAAAGRQAYITYPDGIGRSRVTNTVIEKKLGTRGTGRNWNTVLKLSAVLGE